MRLNMQTDFALRTLMHLAVNTDRRVTISDISDTFGVSKNHLMKVAQALGHEGVIATERGRNGGLSLARPAADISIGDVVDSYSIADLVNGNAALHEMIAIGETA